jgi:HD-GYP domain-containing protein (c-di-GMP phosphodiesterase class II)
MSFDTFKTEKSVIDHADGVLADPGQADLGSEYKQLAKDYKKLFKVTRRLVKMSDRSEVRLKDANTKIQHQQLQLEKAHKKLSDHAHLLEEKVKDRTKELVLAQGKLEKLVELGIALSVERQYAKFIEMIVQGEKELTNADGGILFSCRDDESIDYEIIRYDTLDMRMGGLADREITQAPIPLRDDDDKPRFFDPIAHAVLTERTVNVPNVYESKDFNFSGIFEFDKQNDYRTQSFLAVPLKPRKGEVIGVLVLINARVSGTGRMVAFSQDDERFIEALASQAAVAMDNKNLVKAQARLFDSVIKVIASAIDTKSPYTGGHCARVPELGSMLARAACESELGSLADFYMNETEWREFYLAGWLHDCGKVTTPEYVVDKATKLETIYNRIHEIRMRFEVIWRDERIAHLEALAAGGETEELETRLVARQRQLQDDFEFVAECNAGGEFMDPDRVERLQQIAQTPWLRYFDDRAGLSQDELQRLKRVPKRSLPVEEKLLADKKGHVIRRPKDQPLPYDPKALGLKIKVPKHLYNLGELYNLTIAKGTLTDEERFKINEHSINTIIMLDALPFPKDMARVPIFAGAHHETMIGSGYPRGLSMEKMPVQAKILAIADIFEALTASDRPYKKAKTLSQALRIMSFFRNDRHIDSELFDLFLLSGAYLDFAEKFLAPEQIDEVDPTQYLSDPKLAEEVI